MSTKFWFTSLFELKKKKLKRSKTRHTKQTPTINKITKSIEIQRGKKIFHFLYHLFECFRALVSLTSPLSGPIDISMKKLNSSIYCFQGWIWFLFWKRNSFISIGPFVWFWFLHTLGQGGPHHFDYLSPSFIYQLLCNEIKTIHACKNKCFLFKTCFVLHSAMTV